MNPVEHLEIQRGSQAISAIERKPAAIFINFPSVSSRPEEKAAFPPTARQQDEIPQIPTFLCGGRPLCHPKGGATPGKGKQVFQVTAGLEKTLHNHPMSPFTNISNISNMCLQHVNMLNTFWHRFMSLSCCITFPIRSS